MVVRLADYVCVAEVVVVVVVVRSSAVTTVALSCRCMRSQGSAWLDVWRPIFAEREREGKTELGDERPGVDLHSAQQEWAREVSAHSYCCCGWFFTQLLLLLAFPCLGVSHPRAQRKEDCDHRQHPTPWPPVSRAQKQKQLRWEDQVAAVLTDSFVVRLYLLLLRLLLLLLLLQ